MSRVEIHYPDDKWIPFDWPIKPQDKQLCVVIPNIGNKNPLICQWRWGNHNHVGMDAFCDISERIYYKNTDIVDKDFVGD